jgi:hypothetical protein
MTKIKYIESPLLLVAFLFSTFTYSLEISITNLCEDSTYAKSNYHFIGTKTVASITHDFFNTKNISNQSTPNAITSILNTPTGLDGYEVISDEEMFVYGWCYSVNGTQPDKLMSEVEVNENDNIEWFYGSAHYLKGKWLTYCEPSYLRNWQVICYQ